MLVLGADPGIGGALALVDLATSKLVSALDMPIMRFETKTRVAVDPRAVGDWLGENGLMPDLVVIEHQQPMPGDGKSNAFVLGVTFGAITSVMAGLGLPLHFVVPQQWKRRAALIGKPKEQALIAARQLFGLCPEFQHGRGFGDQGAAIARADAALIAWHGLPEQMRGEREVVVRPPKPFAAARKKAAKPTPPEATLL